MKAAGGGDRGSPGSSGGGKTIGCIGRCTSGLTLEELDIITDNIHKTLTHSQGRKIFRKYLSQGRRKTPIACLELYEQITEYIDNERTIRPNSSGKGLNIEPLLAEANTALSAMEELDDVPEIDLALLERYTEALDSRSRDAILACLEETRGRLMRHLNQAHKGFRTYAMQPCPRS